MAVGEGNKNLKEVNIKTNIKTTFYILFTALFCGITFVINNWAQIIVPTEDIVRFPFEGLLLVVHTTVSFFILTRVIENNVNYQGAFFKLFLIQSCANYLSYVTSYLNELVFGGYETFHAIHEFAFHVIYEFALHFQPITYMAIALNRHTAIVHPIRHNKIWKGKCLALIVSVVFVVPFLLAIRLLVIASILLQDSCYSSFFDAWAAACFILPNRNRINFVMYLAYGLVDCVFELWTFAAYNRFSVVRKQQNDNAYRLLVRHNGLHTFNSMA
ncbi:srg family chemoreceptor domain-containing protein [Ditylenchus destructor]|nr:srg family chemoreceptor domain-containing protein [Ditylenchus destructor]